MVLLLLWVHSCFFMDSFLQPSSQGLPSPHLKGETIGDKFMFMGGVTIYQITVAASVFHFQNRLSGWACKARFRSEA